MDIQEGWLENPFRIKSTYMRVHVAEFKSEFGNSNF